ncbi:redoxin domain-containing protein [Candidatus Peregrinibacteria bacterium]|nr:redoxin domain-containing protein [Candidatus Peregrinibacteria bacterium]
MSQNVHAVDFPTHLPWLNTKEPLTLAKLKGHVVLLDFWTYCCINCIHVLPDLKYLEHKYKNEPFVVIGVHSAKFENEKDAQNIQSAIDRYEIEHPVLVDNSHLLWNAYGIRSWPSFVLIDPEGYVRGVASGEGLRAPLSQGIDQLLEEAKKKGTLVEKPLEISFESKKSTGILSFPGKLLLRDKRLFISDSNNNRILITELEEAEEPKAKIIDQIEGLDHPQGICLVGKLLYICDTENHTLKEYNLETKSLRTLAGTGQQARTRQTELGDPLETALNSPWDLDYKDGKLYIAMAGPHQIWSYDVLSEELEIYAGSGVENILDGPRLGAQLAQPSGISIYKDYLYFADSEVSALRRINLLTEEVESLVGSGLFDFGRDDGPFAEARLEHCLGVDAQAEEVFIADTYNHSIRRADLSTSTLETVIAKVAHDVCRIGDKSCQMLPLFEPNDVQRVGDKLYIADTNNHLIRVFDLKTKDLINLEIY